MRSILFLGWVVTSLAVLGCADLLGIEPWQDPAGKGGDTGEAGGEAGDGGGSADAGTCNNGVQDGTESGVDCGGTDCHACQNGFGCAEDSDCQSAFCPPSRGYCVLDDGREICGVVNPGGNTCADCMPGMNETDVDCGDVCSPCRAGKNCVSGADCLSGTCQGTCAPGAKGAACYTNSDCAGLKCGKLGCEAGNCCQ